MDGLLLEFGITRELTSPDGDQERNGKMGRRIGLIREGRRAAFAEVIRLPDIEFSVKALNFDLIYPEAFNWMSDCMNILARFNTRRHRSCCARMRYVTESGLLAPLLRS